MQLSLEHVTFQYEGASRKALDDVSLTVHDNEFIAVVGQTGSGKSTLIQLLNGLLFASEGVVTEDGRNVADAGYPIAELRKKVGLVFQYPEHQLFEMTVLKDVCFGPKNLGFTAEEQLKKAKEALQMVGIGEDYYEKSPFELSGGEKRRVAIAGILAMKPEVLILDEPTAGLDPEGREEILELLKKIHRAGTTVLLVSHNMEDVAGYCSRVIVLRRGEKIFDGTPRELFTDKNMDLTSMGLLLPAVTRIMRALKEKGMNVSEGCLTIAEAKKEILRALGERRKNGK